VDFLGQRVFGSRLRIIGFSCVHYGDRQGHDADLWRACLEEIDRTPNAAVFGLGDYLDFTRTSYRALLRSVGQEDDKFFDEFDEMMLETYVRPFVAHLKRHCPSFAQKCLGLIEGNHHGLLSSTRFRNGSTTTEEICRLLGVRYLGQSAWVQLRVYRSRGREKFGTGHNLNLLLNHSVSSSGTLPASLAAANRKLQGWRGVDIFLTANDHQLGHEVQQQIGCTDRGLPKMVQHEVIVGKVGSFQKGYIEGAAPSNYVEKKFLRPSHLGYLAFDAWVHTRGAAKPYIPEVWRYGNFSA
jgi:hypothetical protein